MEIAADSVHEKAVVFPRQWYNLECNYDEEYNIQILHWLIEWKWKYDVGIKLPKTPEEIQDYQVLKVKHDLQKRVEGGKPNQTLQIVNEHFLYCDRS